MGAAIRVPTSQSLQPIHVLQIVLNNMNQVDGYAEALSQHY
jgi:hypothetical protein